MPTVTIDADLGGTIEFSGTANANIPDWDFYNLTISGSGTKTATAHFNVNKTLTISGTATLDAAGFNITEWAGEDCNLVMSGGTFKCYNVAGGLIPFMGGSAYNITGGTLAIMVANAQIRSAWTWSSIEIAPGAGNTVTMDGSTTMTGTLSLTSGYLSLGAYNLTITNTGGVAGPVFGSASSTYVVTGGAGSLTQQGIGSTGRTGDILFPVGENTSVYTPCVINNTTGTTDDFTVRVYDNVYATPPSTDPFTANVVDVTWELEEAVDGGSNVVLKVQWPGSQELNGFNRSLCNISHYDGGWDPTQSQGAAGGSDPYTREVDSLSGFSPFAVGANDVLPIELLQFTAKLHDDTKVHLNWSTASELNNDFFTVERSIDGFGFSEIGNTEGAGNSTTLNNYSMVDMSPIENEVSYYRLKQTDFDGEYEYSRVIAVDVEMNKQFVFYLFPNPAKDNVFLTSDKAEANQEVSVLVYDVVGNLVYSKVVLSDANGKIYTEVDPSKKLSAGIYFVIGRTKNQIYRQRLIIKD